MQSPMSNPMIIMMQSPHVCGQTTATTQKQFCNNEGLSDRKFVMLNELQDSKSPNAVRNFLYPEAIIQKHFQGGQDEILNQFDKSPDMLPQAEFVALHEDEN